MLPSFNLNGPPLLLQISDLFVRNLEIESYIDSVLWFHDYIHVLTANSGVSFIRDIRISIGGCRVV